MPASDLTSSLSHAWGNKSDVYPSSVYLMSKTLARRQLIFSNSCRGIPPALLKFYTKSSCSASTGSLCIRCCLATCFRFGEVESHSAGNGAFYPRCEQRWLEFMGSHRFGWDLLKRIFSPVSMMFKVVDSILKQPSQNVLNSHILQFLIHHVNKVNFLKVANADSKRQQFRP